MVRWLALLITAPLLACASAGTEVDPAKVAAFQRGKTTYAEVVAALGAPNSDALMPDGSRVIVYSHAQISTRPATFIPIVGMFAGGADVRSQSVSFIFGPDGVLKSDMASRTQTGSHTGM